ncbi:MAG: FHA domain-containing protein, partial [Kiritimatiellae bacterium]|nr:FHA domain-containing protein [Kiritimatiellia bacterium]
MKRLGLQIVNGALAGKRYEVKEGGLRLGRSSSNDVHVPDGELSRNHCLFETSGEYGVTVTDLASANGTLVNGRLIGGDAVHLRAGDVIEAGGLRIKVVGDAPPAVP